MYERKRLVMGCQCDINMLKKGISYVFLCCDREIAGMCVRGVKGTQLRYLKYKNCVLWMTKWLQESLLHTFILIIFLQILLLLLVLVF